MEFSDDEIKELLDICHAAGCCYPANNSGEGSPLEWEPIIWKDKDGSNYILDPPKYKFKDDKWKTVYDKISDEYDRLHPFSVL
jgi:hypothetical protein